VVQAKVLPRLIESGMASTALVTHVVVSKLEGAIGGPRLPSRVGDRSGPKGTQLTRL
jgi:hypothetical protein